VKPLETHLGMVGNFGIWETKLEFGEQGEGGTPLKKKIWGNQWESKKKKKW
jgi:hypothetical protein